MIIVKENNLHFSHIIKSGLRLEATLNQGLLSYLKVKKNLLKTTSWFFLH